MLTGKQFSVFEHQTITLHQTIGDVMIDEYLLQALQNYYGANGVPYYSLIYKGIRFNEYVGVLQVGSTTIEVLPKADKIQSTTSDEQTWRGILLGMVKAIGTFDVQSTGESNLRIQPNSILHMYFELFVKEVEYLVHAGLVKKYRKKEGNVTALKGNLLFSKQIQHNLIHQERFYVRHTTYDTEHLLHGILYKTLQLLHRINTFSSLQSRIGSLLLSFPEMQDIRVVEATFDHITYNHKTQSYKPAIDIAKLLLLNYHPDVEKGRNNVLALMFDMNVLWEKFVAVSLRKAFNTTEQPSRYFWKHANGSHVQMRPDIVLNIDDNEQCIVLDTKWKNLNGYNPSPEDLRQMYVYHEYFGAKRVALLYPGALNTPVKGTFYPPISSTEQNPRECGILSIAVRSNIQEWQAAICSICKNWMEGSLGV